MKNLKSIYDTYIPIILRSKNRIKYNLSEDNIFGNLNYSMCQDILKGKNAQMGNTNINKFKGNLIEFKPSKLLPILRIKPS